MLLLILILYRGICSSDGSDEVCKRLECFFTPFAEAYNEICQQQAKHGTEFFGLRDFYWYVSVSQFNNILHDLLC